MGQLKEFYGPGRIYYREKVRRVSVATSGCMGDHKDHAALTKEGAKKQAAYLNEREPAGTDTEWKPKSVGDVAFVTDWDPPSPKEIT